MTEKIFGNLISLNFRPDELTSPSYVYRLPEGYSVYQMKIISLTNAIIINIDISLKPDTYVFPIVNGKSPSTINIQITDIKKPTYVRLSIKSLGGIPYEDYFKEAFKPILVTGEDGKEYKVIPSEQFK